MLLSDFTPAGAPFSLVPAAISSARIPGGRTQHRAAAAIHLSAADNNTFAAAKEGNMKRAYAVLLFAVVSLSATSLYAQYPVKSLRLIVPFPPGGGTDTLARVYGQKLGELLGQQVIIDNRPGGGTNIGAEIAAKALPDGYTALMGNIAHA